MGRKKRGRPTDLTEQTTSLVCEYITQGARPADAAVQAGVGRSTYYEWMAKGRSGESPYADFAERVERARAEFKNGLIGKVMQYADSGDPGSWRASMDLYKELEGSSRGAERDKAREEMTRTLLDRLRARLDQETFARVVRALVVEDSGELPTRSARSVH